MYGTVNGQSVSISATTIFWLADGIGIVQQSNPDEYGEMETWKLTSTNVMPAATVPGAPTAISATGGNAQAM